MRRILISTVVISALGMLPARAIAAGEGPTFPSEGYTLRWDEMEQQSEVDFTNPKETKHTLSLKGSCSAPSNEDAVAISTRLKPRQAVDDKDSNVLKPGRTASSTTKYSAFLPDGAEVELDEARLTRSPAALKSTTLAGKLVIAKARKSLAAPAAVMEDDRTLVPGLKYRITSLRMSANRELTVQVKYARPMAGTTGTFLEAIHAIDAKGNDLGGGRWDRGDPFGKSGTATYTFKLNRAEVHSQFRFTAVTEHTTRIITFDVKSIFAP